MSQMDWRQALLRWRIQLRRGTTESWVSANPVLLLGEPGWDQDLLRLKIGDGETAWNDLSWGSLDPTQLEQIIELLENLEDLDDARMTSVVTDLGSDFATYLASQYVRASQVGANGGVASLDSGGKIPAAQLPSSAMEFKGNWNASTNSPTLADGTGNAGDQYRVSVAGTRNLGSGSVDYAVGDAVIYSGTIWEKSDNTESVNSVAGKVGVVTLVRADVGLDDSGLDTAMDGILNDTGSDFTEDLVALAVTPAELTEKRGAAWKTSVFAPPLAADLPVVTIATTSQISGGTTLTPTADLAGDPHFRYDGMSAIEADSGTTIRPVASSLGVSYYVGIESVFSSMVEQEFKFVSSSAGTTMNVRVIVDDQWVATYGVPFSGLAANTTYFIRTTFPAGAPRRVRVEVANAAKFAGVVVPSGGTATRPAGEIVKRVVTIGDSYGGGANGNTTGSPSTNGTSRIETFPHYAARQLECDSHINISVGGTAWVYDGGGGKSTFGQRVPELLACHPHIAFLVGSINDVTAGATFDQVYAAVCAVLELLTSIPVVILTGPERVVSADPLYADYNNAIRHAAAAYGRMFVDTLNTIGPGDYNAADFVHPSAEAHFEKLGPKFYAGIDRAAVDQAVAAAVGGRASIDLTLAASPPSAAASGATVTLTATQSTNRAGVVDFFDNSALIATTTVASAVATYATSALANGSHNFFAKFRPTSLDQVKPAISNQLAYSVSANLGFTDDFNRANGAPGATLNGKTYVTFAGNGAFVINGNKLVNPTNTTGSAYLVADAGTPNGSFSVTLGGSGGTGLGVLIPIRAVSAVTLLRLSRSGSEILLQSIISNSPTTRGTSTGSSVWASGDILTYVLTPTTITIKKNGVNVPGLVGVTISDAGTIAAGIDACGNFGVGVTSASGAAVTFDDLAFVA